MDSSESFGALEFYFGSVVYGFRVSLRLRAVGP